MISRARRIVHDERMPGGNGHRLLGAVQLSFRHCDQSVVRFVAEGTPPSIDAAGAGDDGTRDCRGRNARQSFLVSEQVAGVTVHQPVPPRALEPARQPGGVIGCSEHDDAPRGADVRRKAGHRCTQQQPAERMTDDDVLIAGQCRQSRLLQSPDDLIDSLPRGRVGEHLGTQPGTPERSRQSPHRERCAAHAVYQQYGHGSKVRSRK